MLIILNTAVIHGDLNTRRTIEKIVYNCVSSICKDMYNRSAFFALTLILNTATLLYKIDARTTSLSLLHDRSNI